MGQDEPRAGLPGRHRLPRARRPDRAARAPALQPRRLRLHDLHRQLRPAPGCALGGDLRARPRGRRGAQRQPQLRGAHPPAGACELPRVAAARRRLRARGLDRRRPGARAPRHRKRRRARVPARRLAVAGRGARGHRQRDRRLALRDGVRAGLRGRRALAGDARAGGRAVRVGRRLDLRAGAAVLRRPAARAGAAHRHRRCARPRRARRLGHDRPHLARRLHQVRRAGRALPPRSTASSRATSTRTARAAATTR